MTEVITPAELRDYLRGFPFGPYYHSMEAQLTPFMNMDHENEKVIWTLENIKRTHHSHNNILLTSYGKILYVKDNGSWGKTAQIVKNNYWIQTEDLLPIKLLLKDIRGYHNEMNPNGHSQFKYHDMDCIFGNLSAYLTYLKNKSTLSLF